MSKRSWKKTGAIIIILSILLLLLGLLAYLLYHNRQRFVPKVEHVTYLQVEFGKDTAVVNAGVQLKNRAPIPFIIDSIKYQILNKGERLGWGRQLVGERLLALKDKILAFRLYFDINRYKKQLELQKNNDSMHLDVLAKVYVDPPFLNQQVITINQTFATAISKTPPIKIDSFFVKSFSPEAGYTFQLDLNTENAKLPELKIENLNYQIRLSDSLLINGQIDSTFRIKKGAKKVAVPIHLKTSDMIELLRMKLSKQNTWPYQAKATAIVKADNPLFEHTNVSLENSGMVDTRKIGGSSAAMPSVKKLLSLQLISKSKNSYLQAEVLIHNPTPLPLYLDSARYFVIHKGKIVASGGKDYEIVFPAKGNKQLPLQLAINNSHYNQITEQAQGKDNVPLDVEVLLYYNLKGSKPQRISVNKRILYPVTKGPEFKVTDFGVKHLDKQQGAQLFVKLKSESKNHIQIDDLKYRVVVDKNIEITGHARQLISVDTGSSEIEIPLELSAADVNLLAKGLIEGKEKWDYTFGGTATISAQNSMLQQTEVTLQTSGVFNINSKGSPDYMPEISKIDTLNVAIHYDTAWVKMYAAIYNTLPIDINISKLQVVVIHENDTIGRSQEKLKLTLVPNTNSFAWHSLDVNYGLWEQHVKHHQGQDSIFLTLPATLSIELENLGVQQVQINTDVSIPTPGTSATLLRKVQLRGFSFRSGLRFNALIAVQNANSEGLTIKDIDYRVTLDNGVDISGRIDRTFEFPIGLSEVQVPIDLTIWESMKVLKRQLFGPFHLDYKLSGTAHARTNNPKLSDVYVIFEDHERSNLKEKKNLSSTP